MLSIIIPAYNEEGSLGMVLEEILALYPESETIVADDGSTDRTRDIALSHKGVRVVSLKENQGKGIALYHGLRAATGDICIMMDGDGQNDPNDIARLVPFIGRFDCICGFRPNRSDTLSKKIASKLGNITRRLVLGDDGARDAGCAIRAFKREHVRHLFPFEGLHRYMPFIFTRAGLSLYEIPVSDRPRRAGSSKYTNLNRAHRGITQLCSMRQLPKINI